MRSSSVALFLFLAASHSGNGSTAAPRCSSSFVVVFLVLDFEVQTPLLRFAMAVILK